MKSIGGFERPIEEPSDFSERFKKRESFEVAGGTVEFLDISPERLEVETPILLAPAWGYTIDNYELTVKELLGQGRRVLCLSHPRTGEDKKEIEKYENSEYPREQLRKALNILGALDYIGVKEVEIMAHSEGAVNATIAARLDSNDKKRIKNLLLFAPAGLIGEDRLIRLLTGFADLRRPKSLDAYPPAPDGTGRGLPPIPFSQTEKDIINRTAKIGIKYFMENPARAAREIRDLAGSQIHEMLRNLRGQGVGVIIMAGIDDPVFPMEKMQETVKEDMVDGFLSLRGGHYGEIATHPEKYAVAAEKMLRQLEENQKSAKLDAASREIARAA